MESNGQNATHCDESNFDLDHLDQAIAHQIALNPGITDQSLAEKFGVSRATINRRKNSPTVSKALQKILEIPVEEFQRLTFKAFQKIEELMEHPDPRIQLGAAAHLLRLAAGSVRQATDSSKIIRATSVFGGF